MKSNGTCKACKSMSAKRHSKLKEIGTPVEVGENDLTEFTFYQCASCGSLWTEYVDGGFGGHGRYLRRLTDGLF